MVYSSHYLKKSQNTIFILGIISLLSIMIGTTVFLRQIGRQNGWQKTKGIERLSIVNISPHGFEIVWSTKNPVIEDQWIEWGVEKDIFTAKQNAEYINGVYYAVVTGLTANTSYHYRVRKGTETYELNALVNTTLKTPKEVQEKPISPAYGKVIFPSGKPYANGLLIYEVDGYYPLAVFTKETGEWLLPLTGMINKKSNAIDSVVDTTPVSLKLFAYPDGNVRTTISQTRPLRQAITAGISLRLAHTPQEAEVLGVSSQESSSQTKGAFSIVYPKENAIIPGNTPLIRGVAAASHDVLVLIQGPTKQYSYRTKSDEKGDWLIKYPLTLEAGRYTIAVTTINISGFPLTLRRTFSIIKSGEQVLGEATASPTLIPTVSLVPTYANPTSTPPITNIIPTSTPTIILSPTNTLPTRFIPTATPPVTGGGISGYLFAALFCIVVGTGLVLAF